MGHRFRFIIAAIALTGLAGLLATAPVRTALAAATVLPDSPNAAKGGTIGPDAVTPAPAPDPDAADTPDEALPVVEYDFDKLPAPVKRLREQIIEAASTGDPNKLRPIIDANPDLQLSYNEIGDPIDYIKSLSGDEGGREILAILIEVLQAGYVHAAVGTPDEVYLWPYFARYPVDKLTPRQLVELFKLVYAGDYEDMKAYGTYSYYRVGIGPDGSWKYFIAGE